MTGAPKRLESRAWLSEKPQRRSSFLWAHIRFTAITMI